MNNYLRRYPLRILLVEDLDGDRAVMKRFLTSPECYPKAEIFDCKYREEATAAINQAADDGLPLDCAIVDLKLPDRARENPYPSVKLAEDFVDHVLLRSHNPKEIWIVHWTGNPEHAAELAKGCKALQKAGVEHIVIGKGSVTETLRLRAFIDRALVEKALGNLLDDPFFFHEFGGRAWTVTVRDARRRQPPMNLTAMAGLLVEQWKELSEYRRDMALRAFAGTELEIVESGVNRAEIKHERARHAAEEWLREANRPDETQR